MVEDSFAASESTRGRLGRPALFGDAQRRALVLDAATRVFLGRGYNAATMHDIAIDARMSKKTLYQIFPSKLALFDALLDDRMFRVPEPTGQAGCDHEETLNGLVLAIASVLLLPDRLGLIRLIVTDGQATPELMTAFERLKMGNKLNALEEWMQCAQDAGRMRRGDVRADARMLFGMTIAEPILNILVNGPRDSNEPPAEERIRLAVRIFLRGVAMA